MIFLVDPVLIGRQGTGLRLDELFMSSTLYIKALSVEAHVGVHPWEQTTKQRLCIGVELEIDLMKAASSDALSDALDYQRIAEDITRLVSQEHFQLIETVAKRIADYLLGHYVVTHARIQVSKPGALSQAEEVGVILEL